MTIDRAIEILDPEHREHYDGLEEINEACRMGMEALKRQRWIPVSERLPKTETDDYVLTCVTWKDLNIDYRNAVVMAFVSEEGFVDAERDCVLEGVTHWMPLPEAPEEGGNESATD